MENTQISSIFIKMLFQSALLLQCQVQRQLDKLEHEAKKFGLEINVQKTEQMRMHQSSNLSHTNPLAIKGPQINIVDDFNIDSSQY